MTSIKEIDPKLLRWLDKYMADQYYECERVVLEYTGWIHTN